MLTLVPPTRTSRSDSALAEIDSQAGRNRHIGLLVYRDFDPLDLTGPLEAFFWAEHHAPGSYRLSVMSLGGGLLDSKVLRIDTQPAINEGLDTLIVVGGRVDHALRDAALIDYVRRAARSVRRIASVCTGAFILAEAGVLDGRAATTHWYAADNLRASYPSVRVRGESIYIKDGNVWSSAGISAGIDLALAMIEEDLGREIALEIARMLVVYLRRPGNQAQQSLLLKHDTPSDVIQRVLHYAREHLCEELGVEQLARVAHLSVRQFSRAFRAATGTTPAKAVEQLRVESARPLMDNAQWSLDEIARSVGFKDSGHMRAGFLRACGVTPQALRRRARATSDEAV
jgi:transcriptional regulator GlxA family with amidase domain